MIAVGQFCLLIAFVGSGYAAFACLAGWRRDQRLIVRSGDVAAIVSVLALAIVTIVLAQALLIRDFRVAYVSQYSSQSLPWYYSLSALWVGQAGSLLLWAFCCGILALAYRFLPPRTSRPLKSGALGIVMAYVCFLVAIMVFVADPLEPSLGAPREGAGLSPLLQHPAMLIHPPIVFLGYAGWTVPFAVALASLIAGRHDAEWIREARPWAVFAWAVLGSGILLGALWAYEELGWGGYWSWDPVENGSLLPWLTGTALIHAMMAWQYRGILKKTAILLGIATFGLCNFATFLTRSGLFSSVHAFSSSPIGWMFLVLMVALVFGGGVLLWLRRSRLRPDRSINTVCSREAIASIGIMALLVLAFVTLTGTLAVPLSTIIFGHAMVVGSAYYNNVLIPIGLILLGTTAVVPLVHWGQSPTRQQKHLLLLCGSIGVIAALLAFGGGVRQAVALAVAGLASFAVAATVSRFILDVRRRTDNNLSRRLLRTGIGQRRQYSGFLIHIGFLCVAVGVTGSSLGSRQHDIVMRKNQTVHWANRSIRFVQLHQRKLVDKFVAEAELEVSQAGTATKTMLPAQHRYELQQEWTTEVAIDSTWRSDFYVILHSGEDDGSVRLALIENPLMRWIWIGGLLFCAGALFRLWPRRRSMQGQIIPTRLRQQHPVTPRKVA